MVVKCCNLEVCNCKFILMDPLFHMWLFPFLTDAPLLLFYTSSQYHRILLYKTFNALLLLGLRMEIRYWIRKIIVKCDDLQILAVH